MRGSLLMKKHHVPQVAGTIPVLVMGCDGFMPSSISTCFMNLLFLSVQPPMQLCKTNTPAASGKNKPNSTQNSGYTYIYIYI